MASPTYTLISSNTLSSSAASVTFSSIPSTYTDLVLRMSVRHSEPAANGTIYIRPWGSSLRSITRLNDISGTVSSDRASSSDLDNALNGSTATSNTFSSIEVYLPNYALAAPKPFSVVAAAENNSTTASIVLGAVLDRGSTAVTSIDIATGYTFVSGSSFYLYGLRSN